MTRALPAAVIVAVTAVAALPMAARAQLTEPLVPVPRVPVANNVPSAQPVPLDRGQTVVDRARPEVDALGLHVGPFFVYPRFEVDGAFNDNIFATSSGTTSDFITILAPSVDVRSDFGRHSLNFTGGLAQSLYASHSALNSTDAFLGGDGRLDIDGAHNLHGSLRAERLHEDPGSTPNIPGNAAEPVHYTQYTGTAGVAQTVLRIGYSADLTARRQEFQSVPAIGGGTIFNSAQDNWSYEAVLRGSYEFVPNYQAYVRGAFNIRDYDHAFGFGIPILDSHGFRIDVGARIDLTGITFIEAYVGYLEQDYRAHQFGSISGVDVGGRLVWNPTQLTSVTLKAARTVQDANNAALVGPTGAFLNSPGYLESTVGVSVDHELLRNLLLNGNAAFVVDDFQGIDRSDNYFQFGVGAKYLVNRYFYVGPSYVFQHRDSSGGSAINQFTRNVVLLRVSTQL